MKAGGGMLLEESPARSLRQLALIISIIEPPRPWLKKESEFAPTYLLYDDDSQLKIAKERRLCIAFKSVAW
jgi:hypothetical protein